MMPISIPESAQLPIHSDAMVDREDRIYRHSPWALLPLWLFLAVAALFLLWAGLREQSWLIGGLTLVNGMLAVAVGKRMLALTRPQNWVLRLTRDSLVVNAGQVVADRGNEISIPLKSIAFARRLTVQGERLDSDGDRVQDNREYLQVNLVRADTGPLKGVGAPLLVDGEHQFRVIWRDRFTRLTPSLESLLALLHQHTSIKPDQSSRELALEQLDDAAFENKIRELLAGKDRIGAMELLRQRYGISLTEAKLRVDTLLERNS